MWGGVDVCGCMWNGRGCMWMDVDVCGCVWMDVYMCMAWMWMYPYTCSPIHVPSDPLALNHIYARPYFHENSMTYIWVMTRLTPSSFATKSMPVRETRPSNHLFPFVPSCDE